MLGRWDVFKDKAWALCHALVSQPRLWRDDVFGPLNHPGRLDFRYVNLEQTIGDCAKLAIQQTSANNVVGWLRLIASINKLSRNDWSVPHGCYQMSSQGSCQGSVTYILVWREPPSTGKSFPWLAINPWSISFTILRKSKLNRTLLVSSPASSEMPMGLPFQRKGLWADSRWPPFINQKMLISTDSLLYPFSWISMGLWILSVQLHFSVKTSYEP